MKNSIIYKKNGNLYLKNGFPTMLHIPEKSRKFNPLTPELSLATAKRLLKLPNTFSLHQNQLVYRDCFATGKCCRGSNEQMVKEFL